MWHKHNHKEIWKLKSQLKSKIMKKILFILLAIILTSCKNEIQGYIVCKEYTPSHMCHSDHPTYTETSVGNAVIVHPYVPHNTHHHSEQESEWVIYVANKNRVATIHVDSLKYIDLKVTDKVYYNGSVVTKINTDSINR